MWNRLKNKKSFYIFVSILIAVICWFYVDLTVEPEINVKVRNIPVTYEGMDELDARLLFVIAASVIMGSRWGIAAALLAAASGIADQLMSGVAWHVLFFRPSNWIPYAVYLASAILFGLYRERHFRGREDEDDGLRG